MGLALYRKYRPKGLADVVGQDHIVTTLQNALKSGKISHAYLFTGPKGVGKTSVARILAHEINGLPYTDDSMHLDIIEIDAASNRRIDEIRDLRDKVHIAPTSAKYKVYIIDEVHMLTREAFNALLKTLEEPPAHAVFILATTEAHKVPDTIASRTQRFTFKPISQADTIAHLKDLAKQEKIAINDEALASLADHASGSFRDSINLLDQMVGSGEAITKADVEAMLGLPGTQSVDGLYDAVQKGDLIAMTKLLSESRVGGTNAGSLALALGGRVRLALLETGKAPNSATITLLRQLITAAGERDAYTALELALFEYVAVPSAPRDAPVATVASPTVATKTALVKEPTASQLSPAATSALISEPEVSPDPEPVKKAPVLPTASDESYWNELLANIKSTHNTVYSVLRMAQPRLEGDKLTLVFGFPFHQKQMSQAATQKRIADAVSALLGRPIEVHSIHEKDAKPLASQPIKRAPPTKPVADSSSLKDVSTIFEGAELLD